ncbi:MAG: exodeoxyribonuclease VII small subunit [Saprospiraceae bacterium]|jgi:exodeoxyribonuclease VII small subunit
MDKELTYEKAYEEIQEIAQAMESEQINVDELAEKAARAQKLIQFCREKLRTIQTSLEEVYRENESQE